jgi:hypothetical protein
MVATTHAGSFLVVEGDDDSKFWKPRTARGECDVVKAGGKRTAVEAGKRLDAIDFARVVGVVDNDCDRLRGIAPASRNLVHTDTRDLEGLLLRSSARDKVLAEYGNAQKMRRFETEFGPVREALVARALLLGKLRGLSYNLGVALDFKRLHPHRLLDEQTWTGRWGGPRSRR